MYAVATVSSMFRHSATIVSVHRTERAAERAAAGPGTEVFPVWFRAGRGTCRVGAELGLFADGTTEYVVAA